METFVVDTTQTATARIKCPMEATFLERLDAMEKQVAELSSVCRCKQRLEGMQQAIEEIGRQLLAIKTRLDKDREDFDSFRHEMYQRPIWSNP